MYENFNNTPDRVRLSSNEIAMRSRAQEHKLALLVAGYRKANRRPARSNPLRKILTMLTNI